MESEVTQWVRNMKDKYREYISLYKKSSGKVNMPPFHSAIFLEYKEEIYTYNENENLDEVYVIIEELLSKGEDNFIDGVWFPDTVINYNSGLRVVDPFDDMCIELFIGWFVVKDYSEKDFQYFMAIELSKKFNSIDPLISRAKLLEFINSDITFEELRKELD